MGGSAGVRFWRGRNDCEHDRFGSVIEIFTVANEIDGFLQFLLRFLKGFFGFSIGICNVFLALVTSIFGQLIHSRQPTELRSAFA